MLLQKEIISTVLQKKTYGHKSYATYIIKYNNLKDPDNIIIGSTLKLPDLSSDKE